MSSAPIHDTDQSPGIEDFLVPLDEAVRELKRRQHDSELVRKVEKYLNGDIPEHFNNGPIFYLSRHVASPNFEALRFIELCEPYKDMQMVIGQDTGDKFVSHNSMKHALGKMPIMKGLTRNLDEIVEFVSIVDFDHAQGKKIRDVRTKTGRGLVAYHNELFDVIYPDKVKIVDESEWVDNNHRGDLIEHYKRLLAMLLVKGIMLESYEDRDSDFVEHILIPAITSVEEMFGYRPLIVNLVPRDIAHTRNWDGYPSVLYKIVKGHLETAE